MSLKKQITTHFLKKSIKKDRKKNKAVVRSQAVTEMNYSGTVDNYTLKNYYFTTDGGIVQVDDLIGSTDPLYGYTIINADTNQIYSSGDTLPAGKYYFSVYGIADTNQTINYNYKVSGITITGGTTDMPVFSVTSPTTNELTVPKNTMTFSFQGNNSSTQSLTLEGKNVNITIPTGNFNSTVDLRVGQGFFQFRGTSSSGNEMWLLYYINTPNKRFGGADRYEVSARAYYFFKNRSSNHAYKIAKKTSILDFCIVLGTVFGLLLDLDIVNQLLFSDVLLIVAIVSTFVTYFSVRKIVKRVE